MKASTAMRLAKFEQSCAEIAEMSDSLGPLIKRYLLLKMNIQRCGGPVDEKITLNLREADWPKQYICCQAKFGNRILGMDINWIVEDGTSP